MPFDPTHENMANLKLYPDQPVEVLAADLRRAFSGIVAGNVKEVGIQAIEKFGPYKIHGDPAMMRRMDDLLQGFVAQHRMKLPGGTAYIPATKSVPEFSSVLLPGSGSRSARATLPRQATVLLPRSSLSAYYFQMIHLLCEFSRCIFTKPIVCVSKYSNKYHQEKRLLT